MGRRSFPAQGQLHCEIDSTAPTSDSTSVQAKAGNSTEGLRVVIQLPQSTECVLVLRELDKTQTLAEGLAIFAKLACFAQDLHLHAQAWIKVQVQGALGSKAQWQSTCLLEMRALCYSPLLHL